MAARSRGLKRIRKIGEEEETVKKWWRTHRTGGSNKKTRCGKNFEEYNASVRYREDMDKFFKHENLATDTKQCDKSGENDFTEATSKAEELIGLVGSKHNPKCWLEQNDDNDS